MTSRPLDSRWCSFQDPVLLTHEAATERHFQPTADHHSTLSELVDDAAASAASDPPLAAAAAPPIAHLFVRLRRFQTKNLIILKIKVAKQSQMLAYIKHMLTNSTISSHTDYYDCRSSSAFSLCIMQGFFCKITFPGTLNSLWAF